jgi:hypothetical protein
VRRSLAIALILITACADGGSAPLDAGDVESDAAGGPPDAATGLPDGALPLDAGGPDASVPPSTANVRWIGGACEGPADCPFAGGMCLREGFPNGMCTRECTGICPDRTQAGDTVTACIDGRPPGFDQGLCVSRCDRAVLPPNGCAPGYRCVPRNRYRDPARVLDVCVPEVPASACGGVDELVGIDYPDRGKLWIPGEAQCGGAFPLVVMLHGINPGRNETPSLGGGRNLQHLVRSLIDARLVAPVILAEPVQTNAAAATSTGLYAPQHWEPATHLDRLAPELARRAITLSSISYIGHSGAGCDSRNGLYLVLARYAQLIPGYAPRMKLWGLEDVCYGGAYHHTAPVNALSGKGTAIVNVWSGQGDPTEFENGLIPQPAALPCAEVVFSRCIRHPTEPWCSYRTRAAVVDHNTNPYFFVREAFPQVFPVDPAVQACR